MSELCDGGLAYEPHVRRRLGLHLWPRRVAGISLWEGVCCVPGPACESVRGLGAHKALVSLLEGVCCVPGPACESASVRSGQATEGLCCPVPYSVVVAHWDAVSPLASTFCFLGIRGQS